MTTSRLFVKAEEGVPAAGYEKSSVRYYDNEGNVLIRFEGSKAWRCNNPGNMKHKKGGFAARHGSIGYAMKMAVFPSETSGRAALIARLKAEEFGALTIEKFPEVWDYDNAREYRKMLVSISKLPLEKKIKHLSAEEFERFRKAVEQIEGWQEGEEVFYEKEYIAGVRKRGTSIAEYLIQGTKGQKWHSKNEAIALAEMGRLHAIVVHARRGTYLRPEYHTRPFRDMTC